MVIWYLCMRLVLEMGVVLMVWLMLCSIVLVSSMIFVLVSVGM